MNKVIEFTDNQTNQFRSIILSVKIDAASAEKQLILHKHTKKEYIETSDIVIAKGGRAGMVYFVTDDTESTVLQSDSNRTDTKTKEQALNGETGTLYFVKDQES